MAPKLTVGGSLDTGTTVLVMFDGFIADINEQINVKLFAYIGL